MNKLILASILASAFFIGSVSAAEGGAKSSVQSKARPESLKPIGWVMQAGSDSKSFAFQSNVLPQVSDLVNRNLGEGVSLGSSSLSRVNASNLVLQNQTDVRAYFVGEGADYHNSLGFNTWTVGTAAPSGAIGENASLIFPDASSGSRRTSGEPLQSGDFVNLGNYKANTTMDFFVIADGANGGKDSFAATPSRNVDGLSHVSVFAMADSPFLFVSFEDMLGGGDRDFNDSIIAVDVGAANVAGLTAAPEPAFLALLIGFLGIAAWANRRRQSA